MGAYNARTTKNSDGEDVLHISRTLAPLVGFAGPVVVRSSADLRGPRLGGFTADAATIHSSRADHGGAAKGRLLYVASGRAALAFLGVHVPPHPGPIICEAYAATESANDSQYELMRAHLLAAAQELSVEALDRSGKTGHLAWATNTKEIREELLAIGFRTARKPRKSDCDRKHYLEAILD